MLLAVGEEASRVEGELGKEAEGVGGVRLGRVGEEFL